jgi:localization factor PodJL
MGYGLRKARKTYEPDPRDVVEEAAREAGMSVAEWLDRAAEDAAREEEEALRRRRQSRRPRREDLDRDESDKSSRGVGRLLNEAIGDFDAALKRSERRTFSELESLRQELLAQRPARASVRSLQSDIATAFDTQPEAPSARRRSDDLIAAIEDRVTRVVDQLEASAPRLAERRLPLPPASPGHVPPVEAPRDDERLFAMELAVKELARKLDTTPTPATPNPELTAAVDEMLDALRRIQSETQAKNSAPDAFESLSRKLDALPAIQKKLEKLDAAQPSESPELKAVRAELAALRAGILQQPRLADPAISGLESQFAALARRMDMIAEHLVASRPRGPRDLRTGKSAIAPLPAQQLQDALRQAIGELQPHVREQSAGQQKVLGAIGDLERKIEALKASTAESHSIQTLMPDEAAARQENDARVLNALSSLERKIDTIDRAAPDIAPLLDRVRAQEADPRVLNALAALERKVEAIEQGPRELSQRLDHIQAVVAERPVSPALPSHLEAMLTDMARRIDQLQAPGAVDDGVIDRLQAEIRTLASRMETAAKGPGAAAAGDIAAVERGLQDLFLQMDRMKRDLADTAERAARDAASAAARSIAEHQQASPAAAPSSPAEDALVQRAISDLHVAQQESERRTTQTLEAVHSTLHRVIDRLVDMEREIQKASAPPPPAPMPVVEPPMFQTAPEFPRAPQAQPLSDHAGMMREHASPLAMRVAAQPAYEPPMFEEATAAPAPVGPPPGTRNVAAIRAERLGVPTTPAQAAPPKKEPKSAVLGAITAARSALGQLKRGKDKVAAEDMPPEAPANVAQEEMASPAVSSRARAAASFDMPLEPGSGRPTPGRASTPAAAESLDPKAQFIAAARRAAQAAAEQSAASLAKPKPGTDSTGHAALAGNPAANTGFGKKHAILLGVAALLVAAGAAWVFLSMNDKPVATASRAPQAIERPANERATSEKLADTRSSAREPVETNTATPRQVLPGSQPASSGTPLPPPLTPPSPGPGVADATRVDQQRLGAGNRQPQIGSFQPEGRQAALTAPAPAPEPQRALSPADELLFRFEGLRGGEQLRAAARAGDPAAFHEIGSRFADGRGATRDPKTAALWFDKAASMGHAPARYRLGALYREGRGVERDAKLALGHFRMAAEAGHARAMHNTGVLLAEGVNGGPDYAGAAEWFRKSAELGVKDSQFNLAILYARGLGVTQDLAASYAWFSAAAAHGDEDAAKKRDEVGSRLSADRLAQAKAAAQAWRPKTPDPAANESATPAGGWESEAKQVPPAARATPKANRI